MVRAPLSVMGRCYDVIYMSDYKIYMLNSYLSSLFLCVPLRMIWMTNPVADWSFLQLIWVCALKHCLLKCYCHCGLYIYVFHRSQEQHTGKRHPYTSSLFSPSRNHRIFCFTPQTGCCYLHMVNAIKQSQFPIDRVGVMHVTA